MASTGENPCRCNVRSARTPAGVVALKPRMLSSRTPSMSMAKSFPSLARLVFGAVNFRARKSFATFARVRSSSVLRMATSRGSHSSNPCEMLPPYRSRRRSSVSFARPTISL